MRGRARRALLSSRPSRRPGRPEPWRSTELLVPNAVEADQRHAGLSLPQGRCDERRPTILYDEIDTVFGPKAKENEEIRGLLNAGHRRGAVAGRCVVSGKEIVTEEIPAYCAVALRDSAGCPTRSCRARSSSGCGAVHQGENVEPHFAAVFTTGRPRAPESHRRLGAKRWTPRPPPGPRCRTGSRTATPMSGSRCSRSPMRPAEIGRSAPALRLLRLLRQPGTGRAEPGHSPAR